MHDRPTPLDRRSLLTLAPAAGAAVLLAPPLFAQAKDQDEGDVTPAEDLMREHGVLKRVLLIYDEVGRRIAAKQDFPPDVIAQSAGIIQNFIEQYHEKLEEDHLFPRFRAHKVLVELVDVLHAGRAVTERILARAKSGAKADADKQALAADLHAFVRMYAPHEAREDTVLFPALHQVVTPHEYDAMGDDFEKKEHELFGKEGFEGMVVKVGELEKRLGLFDLAQFTPK